MNLRDNKLKIIIAVLVVSVISGGLFVDSKMSPYNKDNTQQVLIKIPNGSTSTDIANILHENEIIKDKTFFKLSIKLNGRASEFKAGDYMFSQSNSHKEIINKIADGESIHSGINVTLIEGSTSYEIVDKLVSSGFGSKDVYLDLISNPSEFYDEFEFLNQEDIINLEGFLYPETYTFKEDATEKEILSKMLTQFDKLYTDELKKIQEERNMTLQEVVNLASIVEKEAIFDEDRPIIASVFYNRLDINMALQSDATIQYAFDERKEIVTYDDLEIDSPYNSYKNVGLPPTPIASPSIKSIEATLKPAQTEYLYFVATMQGGNNYSKTYEQHLEYVAEYKAEREAQKNS